MDIEIEKGIPLPPNAGGASGRIAKYPVRQMDIGDSFFVPAEGAKEAALIASRIMAAYRPKRNCGFRLCTRRVPGGVRVWRIA